jgi:capsular polysaccharide transport system permease protein
MHRDALQYSEQELSRANQRLVHARTALERARNAEGLLDVGRTANAISDLLTKLKGDRLEIQQEYDTQLRNVSKDAPQMRALQSRLTAADTQIAELESKLTSVTAGQSQNTALSGQFTKFSELELEQQIAQRQYTAAFTGLETARIANERKMIYLNAFVRPSLPEEAKYPKRALSIFAVALISLVLWGALCGAVAGIRNYMA